jgi:outer membrane protein
MIAELRGASKVYDTQIQQATYQLNTLLYSQLLDTEKSLQTAQQNYFKAAYSYLVARLNHDKARRNY